MCSRVLLKERVSRDSVREAFQDERSVLQQRKDCRRDAGVVPHHISLGEATIGEEHLIETRHLERHSPAEVKRAVPSCTLDLLELRERRRRLARYTTTNRTLSRLGSA